MKNVLVLLAIFAISTAAFAAHHVQVTVACDGSDVAIGYDATDVEDPCRPVGIALLVSVEGGEITGPGSYNMTDFPVYLDFAYTEETSGDGFTNDPAWEGHPYAAAEDAPGAIDAATGFPVSSLVICMGRLVEDHSAGPATATIATLPVSGGVVTVAEEATYRGGIFSAAVGVDLEVMIDDPLDVATCDGVPCWACAGQALGDATGDGAVNFLDLAAIKAAFFAQDGMPNYNACADFNRDGAINFLDLAIIKGNFFASGLGVCP